MAVATTIHHATHARQVTDFELADLVTHGRDTANDLMARHRRVNGVLPFITGGMQIGMANTTVENINLNVIGAQVTALDIKHCERAGGGLSTVGFDFGHGMQSEIRN